ncbi:MAG: class I SAM-dependent methyltransferase [Bdellovibrionaceae bacterium]|nr:class I SAM-dependent methyltransferase [Pseudobdellovibrionaceae bacterium]
MTLWDLTLRASFRHAERHVDHLASPPLKVRQHDDFLFVEKLSGFNTHAPDLGKWGLFELLKTEWGENLFVVQRLDKGTSGAMIFARSKEAAATFGELFERHEVKKHYLFVTDRRTGLNNFTHRSRIEKSGNTFVSDPDSTEPNAKTVFKKKATLPFGELWEAFPESGKPHQIRLHAADQGLPILGDHEHGGSAFPRLCLHSQSVAFHWKGKDWTFEATSPGWARPLPSEHALILDAIQSRSALYDLSAPGTDCLRLVHQEVDFCRIDQYGSQWAVNWYAEKAPTGADLDFFETLSKEFGKQIFIRHMHDRGRDPLTQDFWKIGEVQDRWEALENEVRFELRTDSGLSAGLFLDQRVNRAWVRHRSLDLKVLNLFSYTGGFSVNAALGGAREICTVDVSPKFNEWGARNFELNGLDPKAPGVEFWNQDCLLFLKGAKKRNRKWDLILCDPPSFGRSKEGVFKIQKDLPMLIGLLLDGLNPKGQILFSCNYEGWDLQEMKRIISSARGLRRIELRDTPAQGLDFERPDQTPLMKSIIIAGQ